MSLDELQNKYLAAKEEYEKKLREDASLFDPRMVFNTVYDIEEVGDPILGLVRFGTLSVKDYLELNQLKTAEEQNFLTVVRMMQKAIPDLTEKDVRDLKPEIYLKLQNIVLGSRSFLSSSKAIVATATSKDGSAPTSTPKP